MQFLGTNYDSTSSAFTLQLNGKFYLNPMIFNSKVFYCQEQFKSAVFQVNGIAKSDEFIYNNERNIDPVNS